MNNASGVPACSKRTRICKAYSRLSSIKQGTDIRFVYRKGKKYVKSGMMLFVMPNHLDETRLGVSISKKNGNSVVRHRYQRLVKEVCRLHAPRILKGKDLVVCVKRNVMIQKPYELTYDKIEADLVFLLRHAGVLKQAI